MKKGEKETRVESEGGGVLAAAEEIAGHWQPLTTSKCSAARGPQIYGGSSKPQAAARGAGELCFALGNHLSEGFPRGFDP